MGLKFDQFMFLTKVKDNNWEGFLIMEVFQGLRGGKRAVICNFLQILTTNGPLATS